LGADSENRPRRDHFLPVSPGNGRIIAQENGEKWAGAVGLQPVIPKSDRLLAALFHRAGKDAAAGLGGTGHDFPADALHCAAVGISVLHRT
jgi:hypothetical protein